MFYWIYDLPSWTVAFFFAAIFVTISLAGALFVRPFLRLFVGRRAGLNDVVGYVLSFVSVIYGVLLGMLAVVTYQNLTEADRIYQQTVVTRVMPIGNLTNMTNEERLVIDTWYQDLQADQ